MNRKLIGTGLALALALGTAALVRSEEAAKMEKEKPLKMVACPPECGFSCTSRSEKELIDALKTHAKTYHNMEMTDEQAKGMIKTVEMPMADKDRKG